MDKKTGKSDSKKKSGSKNEGENPSHYWRKTIIAGFHNLVKGGWVQNTYCGFCVTLVLAFVVTFFMNNKQTGLFWLIIFAIYVEIGRAGKPQPTEEAELTSPTQQSVIINNTNQSGGSNTGIENK